MNTAQPRRAKSRVGAPRPLASLGYVEQDPFEVKDLGCLAVLAGIWEELGLTDVVDGSVPCDPQVHMTAGQTMKALVLNIVGGRDPLYRVQNWAERVPLDVLIGEGAEASFLNDTSLDRHLDRLFEAGAEKVFNAACMRVMAVESIDCSRVHADTTSRLVFGAYEDQSLGAISITYGHSKDKRPDLKQVMYGLTTSADGVPVAGQLLSGNTSDKTWHGGMLDVVQRQLKVGRDRPVHYVGDSALVTTENLAVAATHGIVLTARLPRTMGLHDGIIRRAIFDQEQPLVMEDLGTFSPQKNASRYEGCVVPGCTLLGHTVQLGVFRPTPANDNAAKVIARRQKKELTAAQKDATALRKARFACMPDAARALAELQQKHGGALVIIEGELIEEALPPKRPRGRPRKDGSKDAIAEGDGEFESMVRVEVSVAPDASAAEAAIEEASYFVLVHTGTAPLTARAMLEAYKGQSVVETRFPFLKDPSWAEVFFAKSAARVETIGYVLLFALLLWSVWERRVRANLAASGEGPLIDTTGMKKERPTAMVCWHVMSAMRLVRRWVNGEPQEWRLLGPPTLQQERVMRFSRQIGACDDEGDKSGPS
jgi:transposase